MVAKSEGQQLDERARDILKLIIRSYVNSGEPVGSRTLAKSMDWKFSPATIRNIMADLEEDGYLAQPLLPQVAVPFAVDLPPDVAKEVHSYHVVVNHFERVSS